MRVLAELGRAFLRVFGLDGDEPPRMLLDIGLGAVGAFAALVLVVLSFEKHLSPEQRKYALMAGLLVGVAILFSKNRVAVILGIVGFIGIRFFVAFVFFGAWQGLLFATLAAIVIKLGMRLFSDQVS